MRKMMALAAVAALGGCASVGTGEFARESHNRGVRTGARRQGARPVVRTGAREEDAILSAGPGPVISAAYGDEEEPFMSWGARAGLVLYAASDDAVKPRLTVGGYGRMLEDDAKRLELAVELTPDIENIDRNNMYVLFAADYVGFIGDSGLHWKAGGCGLLEIQDEKKFFVMGIEAGAGFWFPVGEEEAETAATVNVTLQIPVSVTGGEINSGVMIALTGGYEF